MQKIKKQTKLTYKDQREYDALPEQIEKLEEQIEQYNECMSDPACYNEKGLVQLSSELEKLNIEYEQKVERFLEFEQMIEEFEANK